MTNEIKMRSCCYGMQIDFEGWFGGVDQDGFTLNFKKER